MTLLIMGRVICEVCQKHLPPGKGGEAHFTSKKHLSNIAIQQKRREVSERSIFVTGFIPGILEMQLTDYFGRFGPISKIVLDKNRGSYAFIEFAYKSTRDAVLQHMPHVMYNKRLVVKPRQMREQKRNQHSLPEGENFPELQELGEITDIVPQMVKLLKIVSQTAQEFETKSRLCDILQDIFQQFYPGCQLEMYGSSVSGYGFRGCDVDLHLTLPSDEYLGSCADSPSVSDVKTGDKTLKNLTVNAHLRFLQKVVKKFGPTCRNVLFIDARCPILRFVHGASGIPCDLSCNKSLSLRNTRLLKLYGELESRIHLLIMTLRCWAKKRSLLGSGNRFTSYAFTLIVIFFLQTRNPPVAPSVEDLQKLAVDKKMEANWDCSFCEDTNIIPKSENQQSVENLLKEFFLFFSTFDFTMQVMCLRSGSVLPKTAIIQPGFKSSAICVQDPFELSHNITATISGQHLICFLENLAAASQVCQKDSWGLPDILLTKLPKPSRVANPPLADNSCEIVLMPEMLGTTLSQESTDEQKRQWLERTCEMVLRVLRQGLLFECVPLETDEEENPAKRLKVDSGVKLLGSSLLRRISCSVFFQTWNGRKKAAKGFVSTDGESHILAREEYVSKQIVNLSGPKSKSPRLEFECHMHRKDRGPLLLLHIDFKSQKCEKEYSNLLIFLKSYVPKITEKCLVSEVKRHV